MNDEHSRLCAVNGDMRKSEPVNSSERPDLVDERRVIRSLLSKMTLPKVSRHRSSTPVLVANRTLAYRALESGLCPPEIKNRPAAIGSRPIKLKRSVHTANGTDIITCR